MTSHALMSLLKVTSGGPLKTHLARLIARFVATCPKCGARIPADQVMCSICANK